MNYDDILPNSVLHWNYRGLTEFPISEIKGEESDITDIYLKENLISVLPNDIGMLVHLESLYISGNDITELPKQISSLKCLKCLDVSGNRLRRIPNEIGDVRNLKFLILDENEITELPLRISELRYLRYLSVCDNKLEWLPQRPVHNYHHCEIRFWRNKDLRTLPYSLWYHVFRNQQTRSLNIACLNTNTEIAKNPKCRLRLIQDSKEWIFDVNCPSQYEHIIPPNANIVPSLSELSKRLIYRVISEVARRKSSDTFSLYSENHNLYNTENNNVIDLNRNLDHLNINRNKIMREKKDYYTPGDIVKEQLDFLPNFVKDDLINGPNSRCENAYCKKPIFDFVHYEFTYGNIILIDGIQEVVLSAALCSKTCANVWKGIHVRTIPWTLLGDC